MVLARLRMPGGFTLVELLIAGTMMAVLAAGLSMHLRGGTMVWRRVTDTTEILQRQRVALERLERDLASAFIYDDRMDAYGEEAEQLPHPLFGASSLRWYTVVPATRRQPPSVRFVTYACAERDGVSALWRASQTVPEAKADRSPAPERALPDCAALSLRYAYRTTGEQGAVDWRSEWSEAEKRLPRLVEASLQVRSGQSVRRVFAIPAGVFGAPEPAP